MHARHIPTSTRRGNSGLHPWWRFFVASFPNSSPDLRVTGKRGREERIKEGNKRNKKEEEKNHQAQLLRKQHSNSQAMLATIHGQVVPGGCGDRLPSKPVALASRTTAPMA